MLSLRHKINGASQPQTEISEILSCNKPFSLLVALIASSMVLSGCGSNNNTSPTSSTKDTNTEKSENVSDDLDNTTPENDNKDSKSDTSDLEEQEDTQHDAQQEDIPNENGEEISENLDALGDINVDEGIFDVNLTIPAEYVGDATQEDLDQQAAEYEYKVTKNDDGTATYTMTKTQHKKILDDMANSINSTLSEYVNSEDYPNITNITANENFTSYTITTKSTEPDMNESLLPMALYVQSGVYFIFAGEDVDNVHVDFVNADTGETISSLDSSQMQ